MKATNNRYLTNDRKVVDISRCRSHSRARMHQQKVVGAQLFTFPASSVENRGPVPLRDSAALFPLADIPMTLANISGHLSGGTPEPKDVFDRFHNVENTRDNLSRQGRTSLPVTEKRLKRTIRPMGSRATTPKTFKEDFAQRLRAARILRYEQASDFANDLGIPANTYAKYESGRSLLPHHLIPMACHLLEIDMKVLFEPERKATRRTG